MTTTQLSHSVRCTLYRFIEEKKRGEHLALLNSGIETGIVS